MNFFTSSSVILATCWALFSSSTFAGPISTIDNVRIESIFSFSEFNNGDIVIKLSSPMQGCENGIWLKQTDIGFKINMMLIITAKLNNSNVLLQGYSDQLFPGSSANVCHLYLIILK